MQRTKERVVEQMIGSECKKQAAIGAKPLYYLVLALSTIICDYLLLFTNNGIANIRFFARIFFANASQFYPSTPPNSYQIFSIDAKSCAAHPLRAGVICLHSASTLAYSYFCELDLFFATLEFTINISQSMRIFARGLNYHA
jgi:hypothetical protein